MHSQPFIKTRSMFQDNLPSIPKQEKKNSKTIEEETLQALKNVEMIVEAAGSKKEKILRMTLYISDIHLWDKVDAVYTEFFGEHRPARTVVPTNELHFGFKIEIDAISYI